jgi:hypothetical protein
VKFRLPISPPALIAWEFIVVLGTIVIVSLVYTTCNEAVSAIYQTALTKSNINLDTVNFMKAIWDRMPLFLMVGLVLYAIIAGMRRSQWWQ